MHQTFVRPLEIAFVENKDLAFTTIETYKWRLETFFVMTEELAVITKCV